MSEINTHDCDADVDLWSMYKVPIVLCFLCSVFRFQFSEAVAEVLECVVSECWLKVAAEPLKGTRMNFN